jgi:hypothetical protein
LSTATLDRWLVARRLAYVLARRVVRRSAPPQAVDAAAARILHDAERFELEFARVRLAATTAPPATLAVAELMDHWRPGTRPEPWSWSDEAAHLIRSDPGRVAHLVEKIAEAGIWDPIELGADGRVHHGHHRLVVARVLGIEVVPVEFLPEGVTR